VDDEQKQILVELYDRYKSGKRGGGYSFKGMSHKEKRSLINKLTYLEEKGLIDIYAWSSGFIEFRITSFGVDFVENGFSEPSIAPMVLGDKNILITGSNNTVSNNYNNITLEIENSDLPDELKLLIKTFLYEIKNSNLTPAKRTNKVKEFLFDISSGTISGTAANGLTVLLTSLLSNL